MTHSAVDFEVAIVGYGPVGATLANLLGSAGITVGIFERNASIYPLPRAGHFDAEVMRVVQNVGLAATVGAGLRVNQGMRFISSSGSLLVDWPRPQHVGPQGWHASYRFHQPEFERCLREGVDRFPTHTIHQQCDVISLTETDSAVTLGYVEGPHGELRQAACRYVVGCDGARSMVRQFMHSPVEDLGGHERWIVVDMIMKKPVAGLSDWTLQHCNPARPTTVIRGVGDRRRWEFMLMPADDPTAVVQPERIWELLKPWIGPEQADIERAALYTFHSAVAAGWRKGRLMLAGDAAHQMPPFLGQGLCAGIRDAANLAWKLAGILRGAAHESLLDTYEAERSPHVRQYIELANHIGALVQTTDARVAAQRDQDLTHRPRMMQSIKPPLGRGLHGDAPPPAGMLSDQPVLRSGERLDDVAGMRFAMLAERDLLEHATPRSREQWRRANVLVLPDEALEYLRALGARAVVIRPDRYILGVAGDAWELEQVISRIPIGTGVDAAHGNSHHPG